MIKTYLLLISVFILTILIIGITIIIRNEGELVSKTDHSASLTDILFRSLDGNYTPIKTGDYEILIIFFNSTCDFCHEKARIFERKKNEIQGIKVVWISSEPQSEINQFLKEFNIEAENISILEDTEGYSYSHFDVRVTPTILHYNSAGSFVQKFPDDAPLGFIIDKIKNGVKR